MPDSLRASRDMLTSPKPRLENAGSGTKKTGSDPVLGDRVAAAGSP